jgi:hypothetical protein
MKTLILLTNCFIFSIIVLTNLSFGQAQGKVWARIEENKVLPVSSNNQLTSSNIELNALIASLNITKFEQVVPSSKNTELLKVYEITCNCDETALMNGISKLNTIVSQVLAGPKYAPLYTPDDYNVQFTNDYALDLINAQGAWNTTHGDSAIAIAISDQNFNVTHEELVGKVVHYNTNNTTTSTHGTAVSILAAGNTDNQVGKSAIGFNSSLALYEMNFNEVLAASYAGYDIINISWTSGCFYNQIMQDIINEAYANGSFIIAAAGNGSTCGGADQLVYPASLDHVFSVTSIGATNNHQKIIGNPASTHQHNAMVDLSAPGYDVAISAAPGWYLTSSGTSFAAPQVSGTVALMLAVNPCISNLDIENILKNSSQNIDAINPDYAGKIGAGRLDAAAAVAMALQFSDTLQLHATNNFNCSDLFTEIGVNPNGGQSPYHIQWSNNFVGSSQDSITSGNFQVIVTDAHGCIRDTTFSIAVSLATQISAATQNISCNGLNDGSIDVTVLQGTPNYTYAWDNGSSTEDLINLSAGNYRLTFTDGNGCVTFKSYLITQPAPLDLISNVTNANGSNTGSIDLIVTGGTPLYSYLWNTGATTQQINQLNAGVYSVSIIDQNGCVLNSNFDIIEDNLFNGIQENGSASFKVFPNPSNTGNIIHIENDGANEIRILDFQGKIISQQEININNTTFVAPSSGVYFIQFFSNQVLKEAIKFVVL